MDGIMNEQKAHHGRAGRARADQRARLYCNDNNNKNSNHGDWENEGAPACLLEVLDRSL